MIGAFFYAVIPSFHENDKHEKIDIKDFEKNSLWANIYFRLGLMQGVAWILLIPLNLQRNMSKMRFTTVLGVGCLSIISIVIIAQLPSYISHNTEASKRAVDPIPFEINWYDISKPLLKDDVGAFSAFSTIIFAYTSHYGVFAVYNMITDNTKRRVRKVITRSVILDGFFYLLIGIFGYITQPFNTPKLIIDRNIINGSDNIMTGCKLLAALMLICKLPVSFNSLRNSLLNLIFGDNEVTWRRNVLITLPFSFTTAIIGALYTDIGNIIDFLGGFCATSIAFVIPVLIYLKGNKYSRFDYRNVCAVLFFGSLIIIGFTSAGFALSRIIKSFY